MNQEGLNIRGKQKGAISISQVASAALSLPEGSYQLSSDVDCYISIEGAPVATLNDCILFADNAVIFYVPNACKISAIANTGITGTLRYQGV